MAIITKTTRVGQNFATAQIIIACMMILSWLWLLNSECQGNVGSLYTQFSYVPWDPSQKIPLKIWSTTKSRNLPTALEDAVASWKLLNPSVSWQLDEDEDVLLFLKQEIGGELWETVQRFMNQGCPAVMIADIWRYAILYRYGGIYSDVDVVCKQPVHTWLPPSKPIAGIPPVEYQKMALDSCSILIGLENDFHFCQWTFASVPGHPILKRALELIIERGKDGLVLENKDFVHYHTGPAIFTAAIINITFPDSAVSHAKEAWTRLWSAPSIRQRLNACFVGASFFNEDVVQNLYASQWIHGVENKSFSSWLSDVNTLIHANKLTS